MRRARLATALVALLMAACGTSEVLVPYDAAVPVGVDLSGRWQLRDSSAGSVERISESGRAAAGGEEGLFPELSRRSPGRGKRRSGGDLMHVFVETGRQLKITQTADGLFISFDRAIVEEYRFGEHRPVNVGEVSADRVSGWKQSAYVIETLGEDGTRLRETWRLRDAGRALARRIVIRRKERVDLDVAQVFDRL